MNNKCHKYSDLMDRVLDGQATGEERARLANHLQSCETCRAALREAQRIIQGIASSTAPEAPSDFASNVLARLVPARPETTPVGLLPRLALVAAAIGLVFGILWLLLTPKPAQPSPPATRAQPESAPALLAECSEGARMVAEGTSARLRQLFDEGGQTAHAVVGAALEGLALLDPDRAGENLSRRLKHLGSGNSNM